MASYFIDEKGDYCYIKESISYWDKDIKKPRSTQKTIGKVDKVTGRVTIYSTFIEESNLEFITIKGQKIYIKNDNNYLDAYFNTFKNTIIENLGINNGDNNSDLIIDSNLTEPITKPICPLEIHNFKRFGSTYFLKQLAEKNGLLDILRDVFPKKWEYIFNIVLFILLENKAMSHYEHFVKEYYSFSNYSMKSQRISEFLDHIKQSERDKFYKKWIKLSKENDFLALDITSISSDSELLEKVSFNHNKESNKMKQFNLCMLFGEKSYLPMYQTIYHGSLNDNSTLQNTIIEFSAIIGGFNFKLVMGRGFYSKDNLDFILSKKGLDFIIGVPFTTNYAKKLVDIFNSSIDNMNNYIKTSTNGDNIKGIKHYVRFIDNNIEIIDNNYKQSDEDIILPVFIYFNNNKKVRESNKFCTKLSEAKKEILTNSKIKSEYKILAKEFFDIEFTDDKLSIKNIIIRQDKVDKHLKYAGFSILLSNIDNNAIDTYTTYVKKDVVEKSFHHFKTYLGLDRPYCHINKRLQNISFIMQLCQIIYCSIHKIMQNKDLYSTFSVPKLLAVLNELKSFNVKGDEYIRPITSMQKKIFTHFDIALPKPDMHGKIEF